MRVRKFSSIFYPTVTVDKMKEIICSFLERGFHGGSIEILNSDTTVILRITKYIHAHQNYGLKVHFMKSVEMEKYLRELEVYLHRERIVFLDGKFTRHGCNAFSIDCGRDENKALDLIEKFLVTIAGFPGKKKYRYLAREISPWDEKITSADQKQMPFFKGIREYNKHLMTKSGYTVGDLITYIFLCYVQLFGLFGLLYSIVFDDDTWQLLGADVLSVTIRAPFFGVLSMGLMVAGSLRVTSHVFMMQARNSLRGRREQASGNPGWLAILRYAFCRPMNIVGLLLIFIAAIAWIEAQGQFAVL